MTDEECWRLLNEDSDEEEEFEGFLPENLSRSGTNDVESDIDIDIEDCDFDVENSDDSDDDGSSVDRVPLLQDQAWHHDLSSVSTEDFDEDIGVVHDLGVRAEPVDYFNLFFTDEVCEMMCTQTNLYATQRQRESGRDDPKWHPVTVMELRLYIAINIMMGIIILPRQENYWSTDDKLNQTCISRLVSRTRFEKIGQYFHLSDRTKYHPRGHPDFDPLYKVRPVLEFFRKKCGELYKPGRAISIDDAMIKYNGRLYFKQYTKSKPTPWGIKVWCSADPTTGYLLDFSVYTGKSQQPLTGLGHHVVMTVGKNYLGKGHHFHHDNFFTSVALADDLLAEKTRCCGTIRMNRKGWPKELKIAKGRGKDGIRLKRGEAKFMQMGSMVATVWQDKRTIAVLSTNVDPVMGEALRQNGKGRREMVPVPQPVLTYNANMGGVDLHDQHRAYYPVGRPSRKWWRYLFWFFVQSSLINAFIIFKKTNSPQPRSRRAHDPLPFRLAVFEGLVRGNVVSKRQAQMQASVVGRAVSDPSKHPLVRMPGRKKNCIQCQRMGRRQPSGHGKETVFGCTTCKIHLCKGLCFAQFHEELL